MKRTKRLLAFLLALVLALGATACGAKNNPGNTKPGNPDSPTNPDSDSPSGTAPLVCLISEVPAGDPFVDLTWQGFEKIHEETGAEVKLVEGLEPAEYEEQIIFFYDMGAN